MLGQTREVNQGIMTSAVSVIEALARLKGADGFEDEGQHECADAQMLYNNLGWRLERIPASTRGSRASTCQFQAVSH